MDKNKIRLLAKLTGKNRTISKEIGSFVLDLNRKDLKIFLSNYRNSLQKNRAYATSASKLSAESSKKLAEIFKGKQLITAVDSSVGAGIMIKQDDSVVDFTFKKYINDTIEMLK